MAPETATRLRSECYFEIMEMIPQTEGPAKTPIRTSVSRAIITGCGAEPTRKGAESKDQSFVTN